MDRNTIFTVKNRSGGSVIYSIKEDGIRREFHPGEEKRISFEELEKLSFQPGGRILIERYLQITDKEVTDSLNITTEPEYYMSEADIKELILHGSQDAFLDCLDFAPVGVIDLIKRMAVSLPCNDIMKRRAIKEKTGFDVDKAIQHVEEEREGIEEVAQISTRRVKVNTTSPVETESVRRTSVVEEATTTTPKYKVISTQ